MLDELMHIQFSGRIPADNNHNSNPNSESPTDTPTENPIVVDNTLTTVDGFETLKQKFNFANPEALDKLNGTAWGNSSDAGAAVYGQAGDNGFGAIRSSSLETSNVDLSEELVKLIVAQQAYQAI